MVTTKVPTAVADIASQSEAEAGTATDKFMTPETTKQAIAALSLTLGTPQATTSGTAFDFTSIPSGTKRITLSYSSVSTNGTSGLLCQIGDSGGIETTGYIGAVVRLTNNNVTASTVGFRLNQASDAAQTQRGSLVLTLIDAATFTWVATASNADSLASVVNFGASEKALSAELDRIRFTTVNGTDAFDAGKVNILYE